MKTTMETTKKEARASNEPKSMKVFNLIILDASGSMESIYNQALSGVNETIQTIKQSQEDHANITQHVTLATFSSGQRYMTTLHDGEPVTSVSEMTTDDYRPYGCTALYDAMGDQITHLQSKVKHNDIVLVTVITDGEENASQRWNGRQIKALVDELRQMGWTFTYIGANQDVEKVAGTMGIRNAMSFEASAVGAKAMFCKERKARANFLNMVSKCVEGDMAMPVCENDYFADVDEDV